MTIPNAIVVANGEGGAIFTGGEAEGSDGYLMPFMRNERLQDGANPGPQVYLATGTDPFAPPLSVEWVMHGFDPGALVVQGHNGEPDIELLVAHGDPVLLGIHAVQRVAGTKAWSEPWSLSGDDRGLEASVAPIGSGLSAMVYAHGSGPTFEAHVRRLSVANGRVVAAAPVVASYPSFGSGGNQVRSTLCRAGTGRLLCLSALGSADGTAPRRIEAAYSFDSGQTWPERRVVALLDGVDLTNPFGLHRRAGHVQVYYVAPGSLGMVESLDHGATWTQPREVLPERCARPVIFESGGQVLVYTSTSDGNLIVAPMEGV